MLDTTNSDRPKRRTALIAAELRRYNIDVAAIQETRLPEEGSLTEVGQGYTFFWRGLAVDERRMHGVGLAIRNEIVNKIGVIPVGYSERLMSLRIPLTKGAYATVISAYGPTLGDTEEVKDQFWEDLHTVVGRVSGSDKLILLGDFNARVGRDNELWPGVIGRHGLGKMNNNGLRLLSFCAEHELHLTNTSFQLKNKYKGTWQHPRSKHWHIIDYAVVRQRDRRDVRLTRVMRGAECWTDNRLLVSKLRLTVRPPRKTPTQSPQEDQNSCTSRS